MQKEYPYIFNKSSKCLVRRRLQPISNLIKINMKHQLLLIFQDTEYFGAMVILPSNKSERKRSSKTYKWVSWKGKKKVSV